MQPLVQAFWLPKLGNSTDEYEDALAYSIEDRHFAMADGATESSFADRWAQLLVRQYASCPPPMSKDNGSAADWLAPLQQEWNDSVPWDGLPWFAEEKARAGAHATLVGVSFHDAGAEDRTLLGRTMFWRRNPEKLHWKAVALGDSCLFQVRGTELLTAFPLQQSKQFDSRPVLIGSRSQTPAGHGIAFKLLEGVCHAGDAFFLATDAFSRWILEQHEAGRQVWKQLSELKSTGEFEHLVTNLRRDKSIRNDDTTLLAMKWQGRGSRISK